MIHGYYHQSGTRPEGLWSEGTGHGMIKHTRWQHRDTNSDSGDFLEGHGLLLYLRAS